MHGPLEWVLRLMGQSAFRDWLVASSSTTQAPSNRGHCLLHAEHLHQDGFRTTHLHVRVIAHRHAV